MQQSLYTLTRSNRVLLLKCTLSAQIEEQQRKYIASPWHPYQGAKGNKKKNTVSVTLLSDFLKNL